MSSLRKAVVIGTIPGLRRIQDVPIDIPDIDDELNDAMARLDDTIKKLDEQIAESKRHTTDLEMTRSKTLESIRKYLEQERLK